MPAFSPATTARSRRGQPTSNAEAEEPLPMVEVVLGAVDAEDWVTETLRSQHVAFRLLSCRPSDRGRRRLVRLFEVRADADGMGPVTRTLRARLAPRDVTSAALGADRALLRISVPLPDMCSAAFELGDFCVNCPFLGGGEGTDSTTWNVLVPQIRDARRLLRAATRRGGRRPSLVRAGAYRRRGGLTGRQERALRTALQLGYFDYPRKASLSALAARLGVSRSTALELLRKASSKVAAQRYLSGPPLDQPP